MKIRLLVVSTTLLALISCDKFDHHPYEVSKHTKYKSLTLQSLGAIRSKTDEDTLHIALIGDTQRFFKYTHRVVKKINSTSGYDFVVHTGDLTDFGVESEYEMMHEQLSELNYPYLLVVGNHDEIGNGDLLYEKFYGDDNFSFIQSHTKFIFLNTNSREHNFNESAPDLDWLESELQDTAFYHQAILVMHVPPFNGDFNKTKEKDFVELLHKYKKTLLCINGHLHQHAYHEPYNDGIFYLNTASTKEEKYIDLNVWKGGYEFTVK
jgi:3',5'-cyclic AMP phosphodiesterase CpdA